MTERNSINKKRYIYIVLAVLFACVCGYFFKTTASGFYAVLKCTMAFWIFGFFLVILINGTSHVLQWARVKKGKILKLLLVEAGLLFYLYYFVYRIKGTLSVYFSVQITFGILIMELIAVVFLSFEWKKLPLHRIYLILGIIIGILYLFMQPVGIVPDEDGHLLTAYDLSNSMLGIEKDQDGFLLMREDDSNVELKVALEQGKTLVSKREQYWATLDEPIHSEKMVSIHRKPLQTQKYQYIVPALGILLGRELHLGSGAVFFLGRLFNMLMFVLITTYAMRRIPFGKIILFVLAMTPMSLQQASSFSYDVFVNSTAFLITALTMHLAFVQPEEGQSRIREGNKILQIILLIVACALLFPLKGFVYSPVCFMPFLIIVKKWKTNRREALFFVVMLMALIIVFSIKRISPMIQGTGIFSVKDHVNYTGEAEEVKYSIKYLLDTKDEWVRVLYTTARLTRASYLESMIGSPLGWLTIDVNPLLIYAYVILLVLATVKRDGESIYLSIKDKIGINLLSWGSVAAVLFGMLIAFSIVANQRIMGVQGRYFIPLCFPILLTIRSNRITAVPSIDKVILISLLVCQFFVVYYLLP